MNSSDIIALVAIILSAIISLTASFVSYFMNKINIQAKRSEIAFERRLEAFREIVEQAGKIKYLLIFNKNKSEADFENSKDDFEKALNNFYEIYRKNLVFLPPLISKSVSNYGTSITKFVFKNFTTENAELCFKESNEIEKQIIEDMQKFVGFV